MRYFLEIAFDGKPFYGWQIQAEGATVQSEVDAALSKIFRKPTFCTGCGRTDSGVHARQFFLHFDTENPMEDKPLFLRKFNGITPPQIAAYQLFEVKNEAHARYSALYRTYEYRFTLRKDPFEQGRSCFIWQQPDLEKMNQACHLLIGKQDFKAFSRTNDLKNHICDLTEARFEQKGDLLLFTVTANRFLRNMVRAVVGTLLNIGYGKTGVEELSEIIRSKERAKAGQSVPAEGLYLARIKYPSDIFLNSVHE